MFWLKIHKASTKTHFPKSNTAYPVALAHSLHPLLQTGIEHIQSKD